jgi:hypothetical protein
MAACSRLTLGRLTSSFSGINIQSRWVVAISPARGVLIAEAFKANRTQPHHGRAR